MTGTAQHTFRSIMARADGDVGDDYSRATYSNDDYADAVRSSFDVAPDDRIGPPPPRKLVRRLLTAVILAGLGSAYFWFDGPANGPKWWAEAEAIVAPFVQRVAQASTAAAKPDPRSSPAENTSTNATPQDTEPTTQLTAASLPIPSNTPGSAAGPAAPASADPVTPELPVKIVAATPAVKEPEAPSAAARKAVAADPRQARATAVGLSPELSSVLLAKLSETDFRNAEVAIRKALAETPDDTVLYWPQKVQRGVAQFQIHFVPGAEPNCRRYVVTVAKDGWATTALPMDKCGVNVRAASVRE